MRALLWIRPGTYRGKVGFFIYGKNTHGQSVRIFTLTRDSALRIKQRIKNGHDVQLEDFDAT